MENIQEQLGALTIGRRRTPIFIHGSAQRQCFAFPKHIMDRLIHNPKSPKLWKKLIQSCKWFFQKNPILVFECLRRGQYNGWQTRAVDDHAQNVDFFSSPVPFKIWLIEYLAVKDGFGLSKWFLSLIFKCEIKRIRLFKQNLALEQFSSLTTEVVDAIIDDCVNDSNGEIVPFEKIVECMPKLQALKYYFLADGHDVTAETAKEFVQMENVKKLHKLELCDIPSTFDFDEFSKFMLENKQIRFFLFFRDERLPDEYIDNVEDFVEKMMTEDYGEHQRPKIYMNGFDMAWEQAAAAAEEDNDNNV